MMNNEQRLRCAPAPYHNDEQHDDNGVGDDDDEDSAKLFHALMHADDVNVVIGEFQQNRQREHHHHRGISAPLFRNNDEDERGGDDEYNNASYEGIEKRSRSRQSNQQQPSGRQRRLLCPPPDDEPPLLPAYTTRAIPAPFVRSTTLPTLYFGQQLPPPQSEYKSYESQPGQTRTTAAPSFGSSAADVAFTTRASMVPILEPVQRFDSRRSIMAPTVSSSPPINNSREPVYNAPVFFQSTAPPPQSLRPGGPRWFSPNRDFFEPLLDRERLTPDIYPAADPEEVLAQAEEYLPTEMVPPPPQPLPIRPYVRAAPTKSIRTQTESSDDDEYSYSYSDSYSDDERRASPKRQLSRRRGGSKGWRTPHSSRSSHMRPLASRAVKAPLVGTVAGTAPAPVQMKKLPPRKASASAQPQPAPASRGKAAPKAERPMMVMPTTQRMATWGRSRAATVAAAPKSQAPPEQKQPKPPTPVTAEEVKPQDSPQPLSPSPDANDEVVEQEAEDQQPRFVDAEASTDPQQDDELPPPPSKAKVVCYC